MAAGEFADPIYNLIEELGGRNTDVGNPHEYVLGALIAYLSHDSIKDFVEYFRQTHGMISDVEDECYEEPDYHLCMDCQASYDTNKTHVCDTNPPIGTSKYFSSLIPEC